jgi:hypothetical protein
VTLEESPQRADAGANGASDDLIFSREMSVVA